MKKCSICKKLKTNSEFGKGSRPNTLNCRCKKCRSKVGKKYYKKNKTSIDKRNAEWKNKNPNYQKVYYNKRFNKHIISTYKITFEQYQKILKSQNYCCKICGIHQSKLKRRLCVDHNHITNKVRGLLCTNCNTSMGIFKIDLNSDILLKALEYYEFTKEKN